MAGLSKKHVHDIKEHTEAIIDSCKNGIELGSDECASDVELRLKFIRNQALMLEDYIERHAEARG